MEIAKAILLVSERVSRRRLLVRSLEELVLVVLSVRSYPLVHQDDIAGQGKMKLMHLLLERLKHIPLERVLKLSNYRLPMTLQARNGRPLSVLIVERVELL